MATLRKIVTNRKKFNLYYFKLINMNERHGKPSL